MVEGGRRIVGATQKHREDQRSESGRQSAFVARLHHQHLGEQTRPVPRIQKLAGTGREALPPSDQVAQHGLPRSKTRQKLGQMPLLPTCRLRLRPRFIAALRGGCEALAGPRKRSVRFHATPRKLLPLRIQLPLPLQRAAGERGNLEREPLLVFHLPAQQISVLQGPRARGLQLEDLVLEVILLGRRGPVGRQGGLKLGLLPAQDGAHELQSALVGRKRGRLFGPSSEHSELTRRQFTPPLGAIELALDAGHPLTQRRRAGFEPVGLGLHAVVQPAQVLPLVERRGEPLLVVAPPLAQGGQLLLHLDSAPAERVQRLPGLPAQSVGLHQAQEHGPSPGQRPLLHGLRETLGRRHLLTQGTQGALHLSLYVRHPE